MENNKIRVLFTTPILKYPTTSGPSLRIQNSIKALSKVSELYIVVRAPIDEIGGNKGENYYSLLCEQFHYAPSKANLSNHPYIRLLQRVVNKLFFGNQDLYYLINLIDKLLIDIVWFGYGNISFPLIKKLKRKRPELKVVCDTDSVWSRYVLRELPYENDLKRRRKIERTGKRKEREEKEWVNLCNITTAVSDIDAEYYKSLTDNFNKIQIFSNVINLKAYDPPPPPVDNLKKPCLYLAGTFWQYSPMHKAACWVIDEIFPRVQKYVPGIHLYIVGNRSKETIGVLNNPDITVTGTVPSVLPYLCYADVALVPLKFESGTRFKILEAGTCGIPIVSTALGAEGIPVTHGKDILLADSSESFADAIIALLNDKNDAIKIGNNCRDLIHKNYTIDNLEREAINIIKILENN
jgi:glycosyltransferase involved in cell wall biosynthesis